MTTILSISALVAVGCLVVLTVYAVLALKGIRETTRKIDGIIPDIKEGIRVWSSLGRDLGRTAMGADRAVSDLIGLIRVARTAFSLLSAASEIIGPSKGIWGIIGRIIRRKRKGGKEGGEGGG